MTVMYKVTPVRPRGLMYHGPDDLALRHETNSINGVKYAASHHYPWIDNDYMTTKDGVLVCCHSFGVMTKEGFRAHGVPNLPIDDLTWEQVQRLVHPDGYRIRNATQMFAAYAKYHIGVAIDLKGDRREGFRIVNEHRIDRFVYLANKHRVRIYAKADENKKPLLEGLEMFRERGVWTRHNDSNDWIRPVA